MSDKKAIYQRYRDAGLSPKDAAAAAQYDRPDKAAKALEAAANGKKGRPKPSPELPLDSAPEDVLRHLMMYAESGTVRATAAKFLSERGDVRGDQVLRIWVSVGGPESAPPGALHIRVSDHGDSYEAVMVALDRWAADKGLL